MIDLTPLQKLPNNVGDLGKLIVTPKALQSCPTCKNRPIWLHCLRLGFMTKVCRDSQTLAFQYKIFLPE